MSGSRWFPVIVALLVVDAFLDGAVTRLFEPRPPEMDFCDAFGLCMI